MTRPIWEDDAPVQIHLGYRYEADADDGKTALADMMGDAAILKAIRRISARA